MLNVRAETIPSRFIRAVAIFAGLFTLTWILSGWIVSESSLYLILIAFACAGFLAFVFILKDWRTGIYLFLVWLVFEDLIRKYAGNSLYMFFGKDIILGMAYISMLVAKHRGKLPTLRPSFLLSLGIFFCYGVVQMFNPNSPHIDYGLLGIKTYFYYVPLFYAGYAILRTEADLRKFLMLNMWIGLVVAGLGLVQTFGWAQFLVPEHIAPELYQLSHDVKISPLTHLQSSRPTSVFVSDGRMELFLFLMFIFSFCVSGYLVMGGQKRGRIVSFSAVGIIVLTTVMSGFRGTIVEMIISTIVLAAILLWGGSRRHGQVFRMTKALIIIGVVAVVGVAAAAWFAPDEFNARWALYSETLSPTSSASELGFRAWDYPEENIESVFQQPNWVWGNGIGVSSLGDQYVYRLTGVPVPAIGAESGYGQLILEMGILGPILWTFWTVALLIASWKVVRRLKRTPMFAVGLLIFWYAFLLLGPSTLYGLNGYQNYMTCAYLWLLIGILFRLPGLLAEQQAAAINQVEASS